MTKSVTKISDTLLKQLLRNLPNETETLADGHIKGLELRISPKGKIVWYLRYRVKGTGPIGKRGRALSGKSQWMPVGIYPGLGIENARALASEYLLLASQGTDPNYDELWENGYTSGFSFQAW